MEEDEKIYSIKRKDFLSISCNNLYDSINTHYKFSWEIAILFISSLAVFINHQCGKEELTDYITTICLSIAMWAIAHIYESNFWYRRNIAIISNIERQFLYKEDSKEILHFFNKSSKKYSVIDSLKINLVLVIFISVILLIYHISYRLIPFCNNSTGEHNCSCLSIFLPYLSLIVLYCYLVQPTKTKREKDYDDFIMNSPGINIDEMRSKKNRQN